MVMEKKTTLQDKSDNTEDLAGMYKLPVNQKVQKVYVNLMARAPGGEFYLAWPALAEIKLLQETEIEFEYQNIAYGKPGHVINQNSYDSSKLTDGSTTGLENVGHDDFPTTFQVDLGSEQFIEEVKIYFEKPGIRFKFKVEVEDLVGNKTVIMDKTDNVDDLEASYTVGAKVKGAKVNVVIEGRAPGGQFYLASPAMTEIKVFAKPETVTNNSKISGNMPLTAEQKSALIDNDNTTSVEFNSNEVKELIFEFDKLVDIYAYELYKLNDKALQYKVEYLSNDNDWEVLSDESNNLNNGGKYVGKFDAVLTNKIRLTIFNDSCNISGFNVYRYDPSIELESYIGDIENKVSKVEIGEYAGNYSLEAKQILEDKISKARELIDTDINSLEVKQQQMELAKAYNKFLKSYISINRTTLLVELTEVNELLKLDGLKDNVLLNKAYVNAKNIYDTYKVTQVELDNVTKLLKEAKEEALLLISKQEVYQEQLAISKGLIETTEIGEYQGNVSQETIDVFKNTVDNIEKEYANVSNSNDVEMLINSLKQAIKTFNDNVIVVDKTELKAVIDDVANLNENDYTKESWNVMQEVLVVAKTVFETEKVTNSQVENAKNNLLKAIDNLIQIETVETDKTALKVALDLANAITDKDLANVVPVVVNEFKQARDKANEVYNDASASQDKVDAAFDRLANIMQKLEFFKGDKTALKAFIDKVSGLEAAKYTEATWTPFNDALKAATSVYEDENAMQEEVNNAYNELVTAFLMLRLIPDKSLLEDLINKAEGLESTNYTKATFDGLTKALNEAKAVFANPNATQVEVDNVKDVLAKAIANLQTVKTPVNNGDTTVSVKTSDESLAGMFAGITLLSVAGYTLLRRKED